jgi:hypothetical protein
MSSSVNVGVMRDKMRMCSSHEFPGRLCDGGPEAIASTRFPAWDRMNASRDLDRCRARALEVPNSTQRGGIVNGRRLSSA